MKRLAFAAAALSLAVLSSPAFAADAKDVIAKVRANAARYAQETQTMKLSQTIRVSAPQTIEQDGEYYKKGSKFRIDSTMKLPGVEAPPMKTVVIHDGAQTTLIPPFGPPRILSSTESAAYRRGDESWSFINETTVLTGEETIGGRKAHVLETTNDRGQKIRVWADAGTFDVVQGELAEDGATFRWAFSDFRDVKDGFRMPHKTTVFMNDDEVSEVTVRNLELGVPVDDALFDPKKAEAERPAPRLPGF